MKIGVFAFQLIVILPFLWQSTDSFARGQDIVEAAADFWNTSGAFDREMK